jgi:hypothetical protein
MKKRFYSIKKPDAWMWECRLTHDEVMEKLKDQSINEHWLVCEHGDADTARPVAEIDELFKASPQPEGKMITPGDSATTRTLKYEEAPDGVLPVCPYCRTELNVIWQKSELSHSFGVVYSQTQMCPHCRCVLGYGTMHA